MTITLGLTLFVTVWLVIAAFWCIGFMIVVRKLILKEAMGIELDDIWDILPKWKQRLFKPLFACPACMASVHGTIIYLVFVAPFIGYLHWIPFCIVLCGLNFFLSQFFTE